MTHNTPSAGTFPAGNIAPSEVRGQSGQFAAGADAHLPRSSRNATWTKRVVCWFAGAAVLGYGASLLVHLFLLLGFSLVVVAGAGVGGHPGGLVAGMFDSSGAGDDGGFDSVIDTRVDVPSGATSMLEVSPLDSTAVDGSAIADPLLAAKALASAGGRGDGSNSKGDGGGTGHKFAIPSGGNVVRDGSFTAWTVPLDPAPRENYSIVIQIALPKRVASYHSNDLSGTVVGTDRYRQELPGPQPRLLPVKKHSVQLEIPVPGAVELVQDTIRIRSKLLNEERELKIVF